MTSGLVYAAIVLLWAVVLVPTWLRRHDESTESRSVDRFSRAMRILSRREPTPDRRYVVMPRRPVEATRPVTTAGPTRPPARAGSGGRPFAARSRGPATGRARLARRRARTLVVLAGLVTVAAALWALGLLPWWPTAAAAVLLVAFVVNLRLQARRAAVIRRRRRAVQRAAEAPQVVVSDSPVRAAAPATAGAAAAPAGVPLLDVHEAPLSETGAEPGEDASLPWVPLPLPLPTYVTAPKAVRPVRVIDLTSPGAWTSGRLLDDEAPTAEQTALDATEAADSLEEILEGRSRDDADLAAEAVTEQPRRAVND